MPGAVQVDPRRPWPGSNGRALRAPPASLVRGGDHNRGPHHRPLLRRNRLVQPTATQSTKMYERSDFGSLWPARPEDNPIRRTRIQSRLPKELSNGVRVTFADARRLIVAGGTGPARRATSPGRLLRPWPRTSGAMTARSSPSRWHPVPLGRLPGHRRTLRSTGLPGLGWPADGPAPRRAARPGGGPTVNGIIRWLGPALLGTNPSAVGL